MIRMPEPQKLRKRFNLYGNAWLPCAFGPATTRPGHEEHRAPHRHAFSIWGKLLEPSSSFFPLDFQFSKKGL